MRDPYSEYRNTWSRDCAEKFGHEFEEFEQRFKNFVNRQYGDGVYETCEI